MTGIAAAVYVLADVGVSASRIAPLRVRLPLHDPLPRTSGSWPLNPGPVAPILVTLSAKRKRRQNRLSELIGKGG